MNKTALLLPGLLLASWIEAPAAIVYTTPGSLYFQDFDSLPNTPENTSIQATAPWIDDISAPPLQTSILGWYLYHPGSQTEGGFTGNQRLRIGPGTANTGSFWSFGSSGSTDRALGGVASNTLVPTVGNDMYFGFRLTNQTGVTLNQFTLSYTGEQWRDGGSATPNAQSLTFMWSTTAAAISDPNTSYNIVPELGFTSPVFANTSTNGNGIDGNLEGRLAVNEFTVTGINWLPGTDLWIRWADTNNVGNDHGLAIDDLNFIAAVPEPECAIAVAAGLIALRWRRRPSMTGESP